MICDIYHLIPINDISRKAGDLAISESLRRMESVCGDEDVVFRIGGDEFVIILQNYDYESIEKLKKTIEEFSISEIKKQTPLEEKKSFAAGFAIFNHFKDNSFSDVMNRADAEMYENKKQYGNN